MDRCKCFSEGIRVLLLKISHHHITLLWVRVCLNTRESSGFKSDVVQDYAAREYIKYCAFPVVLLSERNGFIFYISITFLTIPNAAL